MVAWLAQDPCPYSHSRPQNDPTVDGGDFSPISVRCRGGERQELNFGVLTVVKADLKEATGADLVQESNVSQGDLADVE